MIFVLNIHKEAFCANIQSLDSFFFAFYMFYKRDESPIWKQNIPYYTSNSVLKYVTCKYLYIYNFSSTKVFRNLYWIVS